MIQNTAKLLEPVWSDPSFQWNWRMASHLMNRAGFGGSAAEIDRLVQMGPQASVNHLINYRAMPDTLSALEFSSLSHPRFESLREHRRFMQSLSRPEKREYFQLYFAANFAKMQEMRCWWINRMVQTRRPLEEKMTLFWHGLFVSAFSMVNSSYHMYLQNQLFRRFATGSAKELTVAVSRDPAMLRYLNNNQNRKGHPNENYARELMELFTMGIGNYTEEDVRESARAWTGWTFVGDTFAFRAKQHDFGRKTFLGETGDFDGRDIVNIIFSKPATATHFATKLAAFFGSDDPPPELILALAQTLRHANWHVDAVLKTLFSSRWFYSDQVVRRKIKSPIELVAGALRALQTPVANSAAVLVGMTSMGQQLFEAPNVGGWPHGRGWINTSTLFARYAVPLYMVAGRPPWNQPPAAKAGTQLAAFETGFSPGRLLAERNISTTAAAVDFFIDLLIQDQIEPKKRDALLRSVSNSNTARDEPLNMGMAHWKLLNLLELVMAMPEYQLC